MQRVFAIVFALTLVGGVAQGKSRHAIFRIHTEANAQDGSAFASSLRAKLSGRDVVIEKIPRISEQDVTAFMPYSHGNGDFGALFQLDDHGRIELDTLSVERRGTYVFVFINGRAITEMLIDKRVSDGKIYVPSGLTDLDIQLMKKDWPLIGKGRR